MPARTKAIIVFLLCCAILSALFAVFHGKIILPTDNRRSYFHTLPFALLMGWFLFRSFYKKWLPSSQVAAIARRLGLTTRSFLMITAIILGLFSVFFFVIILSKVKVLLADKFSGFGWWSWAVKYFMIAVIVTIQFVQLENSALYEAYVLIGRSVLITLVNIWVVLAFNLLVVIIVQSWRVTLVISSFLFFEWSIVDYYVVMFHGSPLFLSELVNIRTAAQVASGYHFPFTMNVGEIIVLFVFCLISSLVYVQRKEDMRLAKRLIIRGAAFVISIIALCLLSKPIIKMDKVWDPWQFSVSRLGFLMCTIEDVQKHIHAINMPEGYTAEALDVCEIPKAVADGKTPDFILILNETFSNLDSYTDVNADLDYTADFYSITGASFGYAAVPGIGGGTNNSEMELLSSRSMMLLQGSPFTYMNSELLSHSIASYLNDLGYITYGMHCENAYNYSRNTAYPAMGFENVLFDKEDFTKQYNGNRAWLDSDNYKDLIHYYETTGEAPRFMYLLTFQNHGGYEQNDDSLDTVHTQNDFGDRTDDVNEYLSSVRLSFQAFKELTDYFASVDRDVIICMVGDHAPSFVSSLPANTDCEIDDTGINLRCVPYVIWSNFDADLSSMYTDYASMVDLVPMVLHASGIPLSAYYQYILDLHEILPIRTSYGAYVDRDMNTGIYDPSDPYYDKMKLYYYLEYNSLTEGEEYREELFAVPNG